MQPVDLIKEGISKVLPGRSNKDSSDKRKLQEDENTQSEEPMADAEKLDQDETKQDQSPAAQEANGARRGANHSPNHRPNRSADLATEKEAQAHAEERLEDEGEDEREDEVAGVTNEEAEATGPIAILTRQHREVEAIFEQIEHAGARAHRQKEKLVQTLAERLQLHMTLEEKVFYPGIKELDEDTVLVAYEEHDSAKMVLAKLLRIKASDETFDAKCSVLKELIEKHVREEEGELFPMVKSAIGAEHLAAIGDEMLTLLERGIGRRAAPVRAASTRKKPSGGNKLRAGSSRSSASKKAGGKAKKKAATALASSSGGASSRGRSSKKKTSGRRR